MSILNDSVTSIKQAIVIADQIKNIELRALLVDAKEEVLGVKDKCLNLEEENQSLRKQLKKWKTTNSSSTLIGLSPMTN